MLSVSFSLVKFVSLRKTRRHRRGTQIEEVEVVERGEVVGREVMEVEV